MKKQELYSLSIKLFREYRAALVAEFYEEKEAKARIDEVKKAILSAVRKTKRFGYYSFSGLSFSAYKMVSKAVEGEADHIGALNRYLERCAETLSDEVSKIMATRKEPWNVGTEMAAFERLSEEYRKLFEGNYPSIASIERELRSIRRRMNEIYTHPKMTETVYLKFTLLETIAKPTGHEESADALDAALSREAFLVLEKLRQALKRRSKKRSKKPR